MKCLTVPMSSQLEPNAKIGHTLPIKEPEGSFTSNAF